jgi:hypothetical protein
MEGTQTAVDFFVDQEQTDGIAREATLPNGRLANFEFLPDTIFGYDFLYWRRTQGQSPGPAFSSAAVATRRSDVATHPADYFRFETRSPSGSPLLSKGVRNHEGPALGMGSRRFLDIPSTRTTHRGRSTRHAQLEELQPQRAWEERREPHPAREAASGSLQ